MVKNGQRIQEMLGVKNCMEKIMILKYNDEKPGVQNYGDDEVKNMLHHYGRDGDSVHVLGNTGSNY